MNRAVQRQILRLEREQVRAFNRGDVRSAVRLFDQTFVGFSSTVVVQRNYVGHFGPVRDSEMDERGAEFEGNADFRIGGEFRMQLN